MRFLLLFTLLSFSCLAQDKLSEKAQVSLITIGPGNELYSIFGHSAIRFYDPVMQVDEDFNYGTFDFDTQGFYVKFLRGTLPYIISSNSFALEYRYWTYENRNVSEQILDLNQEQKERLFNLLIENMQPENREYQYKFFYDNCSTRLKDILDKATKNEISYDETLHADSSYREWIDSYAKNAGKYWSDLGMDISIGLPSDVITGWKGAVFLPDNLHDAFKNANLGGKPLVKAERTLYQHVNMPISHFDYPFWIFLLFSVLIAYLSFFRKTHLLVFDKVWFFILGLMGLFFCFLWWGTDHGVTAQNMSLLWAMPFWIVFSFIINKETNSVKFYLLFCLFCSLIFLVWGIFNLNKINLASLFIALIGMIRIFYHYNKKYKWKI